MEQIEIGTASVPLTHFVDGTWVGSQTTFTVRSPLDWKTPLCEMGLGTIDTGAMAIEAARRASSAWSALGPERRASHLHRLADVIVEQQSAIATVEAVDAGVLFHESLTNILPAAIEHVRSAARLAMVHSASDPTTQRIASGVSLILGTWRSPFLAAVQDAAYALAAGNTVVLKPDEWAPLSLGLLGVAVEEAELPPGVLNIVQGVGEAVGDSLVTSSELNRLTLSGSIVSARNNAVMASRNLNQFRLDVTAKATYIVLEDADLEDVARAAAAHFSTGDPASLAGVRVLASRHIAKPLLEMLASEMSTLVAGDTRHLETTIPPVIHQQPVTRLHALVDRCRSAGDEIVTGGKPIDRPGLFFAPTLIKPRGLQSEAVSDEVIGPVVTFEVFDADHGAVMMANSAKTPVIASIYTQSSERAATMADELDCVLARINHPPISEELAPVDGSATPTRLLDFHTKPKTVAMPRVGVGGHEIPAVESAEIEV